MSFPLTHHTFLTHRLTSSPPPRGVFQRIPGSVRCELETYRNQKQNPSPKKSSSFSSNPYSNRIHFYFIFPNKNQAQLTPGNTSRSCRCVFPSVSVPVQSDSHRFYDTVHSAPPPQLKGLLGKEEEEE